MATEAFFQMEGRHVAWFPLALGALLAADAAWCAYTGQLAAALVVGGIAGERLVHCAGQYLHRRLWPWRIEGARIDESGLEIIERNSYDGSNRSTRIPSGLLLRAAVQEGRERAINAPWVVVVNTIFGTIIWSEHRSEDEAHAVRRDLHTSISERDIDDLAPPQPTGNVEVIASEKAVMWGTSRTVPLTIAARCVLLTVSIVALPLLAQDPTFQVGASLLALVTVALLAFPFAGAVAVLMREDREVAFGASASCGELRAWERSRPVHALPVQSVRHVGWQDLRLSGRAVAVRLVAHAPESSVVSFVSRLPLVELSRESYRLLADAYPPRLAPGDASAWSVRMCGGVGEAVEAASWLQWFVAQAGHEPPRD